MDGFVIGSHNAWSYLSPRKWWMKVFNFMSKCQKYDIKTQYEEYNSRCFDLRVRFDEKGNIIIAHGLAEYKYSYDDLFSDLNYLKTKNDVYLRILHEVRTKEAYTQESIDNFKKFCKYVEMTYPTIKCWCGRNLYNWEIDYQFKNDPSCEELYSSVCPPKYIDDWIPILYAKLKNKENIEKGTDKEIMLIDFVNIQ
jgi:hypothetical protein